MDYGNFISNYRKTHETEMKEKAEENLRNIQAKKDAETKPKETVQVKP